MREILFRGKAINRDPNGEYRTSYQNGDWVYGLLTKMWNEEFPSLPAEITNENGISGIEVDQRTIGQYTGLDDLSGKKIFEGDIVKVICPQKHDAYKIVYGGSYFLGARVRMVRDGEALVFTPCTEVKVIGNIHDNPELLKGVKQ